MGRVAPIVSAWLFPPLNALVLAPPCVAVAVIVTGGPARPVPLAVAPCALAMVPRTRVAVARPVGPVTDEGLIEPPPVTPQVTVTPPIGLLFASVTVTLYGVGRVAPIVSV